jgi:hypothetical protein
MAVTQCTYKKRNGEICSRNCRGEKCSKHSEASLKYRRDNAERIRKMNNAYYQKNKDKIIVQAKARAPIYRTANKIEISQRSKARHVERKAESDYVIKKKIQSMISFDKLYQRPIDHKKYVSLDWVKTKLVEQDGKCFFCEKHIETSNYEQRADNQFSIDRIDNSLAHEKDNCNLVCFECNRNKQKKDIQVYIDEIKLTLRKIEELNNQ